MMNQELEGSLSHTAAGSVNRRHVFQWTEPAAKLGDESRRHVGPAVTFEHRVGETCRSLRGALQETQIRAPKGRTSQPAHVQRHAHDESTGIHQSVCFSLRLPAHPQLCTLSSGTLNCVQFTTLRRV